MSKPILPPTTADINPGAFSDDLAFASRSKIAVVFITIFLLVGFSLRVGQLGTESLGEDELNKLETVEEYRTNGLTGKNGEHPFLMKGLQTVSIIAAESWNSVSPQNLKVTEEAALRFPLALFGTFSALLIFLLASALFGRTIGLVAAGLYAVEPMAIGFDRIAKEDSLVVFFFLLMQLLWVRSQTAAERGQSNWPWYAWGSASAFAALMASKYYPHLLAVSGAYYNVFRNIPGKVWDMGKERWLKFFVIMGLTFLVLNPTILLPETWREMLKFSSESRIGHDSYEYMGALYRNQMTAWLSGVPWTFYYVFLAVKSSLPTLLFLLIGLPLIFRRRMGDGRFLVFFWAFMWFLPFTFLGGKFTRYFAFVTPLVFIVAATGFYFSVKWLSRKLLRLPAQRAALEVGMFVILLAIPLTHSAMVAPHFRLFTNAIGGGMAAAGSYFPHDEFYDAATRQAVDEIARHARPGAVVACETPGLYAYYARRSGREDLNFVSLSQKSEVVKLSNSDLIVLVKGRRYFSNTPYHNYLQEQHMPVSEISIAGVPATAIYMLDEAAAGRMHELAR